MPIYLYIGGRLEEASKFRGKGLTALAHRQNDRAVMLAYGFSIKDTSEADCVAALMKMYQEFVMS